VTEELYHSFKPQQLYERIASHIEDLVGSGKLQLGEKLPAERELAERLGVGRGAVREAIKLLRERGLVTIFPGRGTFVAELDTGLLSDQLGRFFKVGPGSCGDLNEVRQILEVEISGLAAQRAGVDDLAEMKRAIEEMEIYIASPDEYIEADSALHLALARATRNELFPLLIDVMADLLQDSRRMIFRVPGAPERGQAWHRLIYKAVEEGDAPAAREAMQKHMQQVSEDTKVGEFGLSG